MLAIPLKVSPFHTSVGLKIRSQCIVLGEIRISLIGSHVIKMILSYLHTVKLTAEPILVSRLILVAQKMKSFKN